MNFFNVWPKSDNFTHELVTEYKDLVHYVRNLPEGTEEIQTVDDKLQTLEKQIIQKFGRQVIKDVWMDIE
jgi:hypothetical protein